MDDVDDRYGCAARRYAMLGRRLTFSAAKAQRVLGFSPRPAATTIVDRATSVERAFVASTTGYQ